MKKLLVAVSVAVSLAISGCGGETVAESGSTTSAPDSTDTPTTSVVEGPDRVLTSAGESFGMCAGWCRHELVLSGDEVTFTQSQWQNDQTRTNSGRLTSAGLARLVEIEASLIDVELDEQYGCPDCADGGASWVVLDQPSGEVRSTYNFAGPPAELADVDGFVDTLEEALATCSVSALLDVADDCRPMER